MRGETGVTTWRKIVAVRVADGRCGRCGEKRSASSVSRCDNCLRKAREYMAKRGAAGYYRHKHKGVN